MEDKSPPLPYEPRSLLELIDRGTLLRLVTGFREEFKLGEALYCYDRDGELQLIAPQDKRYWSQLCTWFRSDPGRESQCHLCNETRATEYMGAKPPEARCYACDPLGLTDMAAPIMIRGRPMGAVLAGQRIPADSARQADIRNTIISRFPTHITQIDEALGHDLNSDLHVCDDDGLKIPLEGLKDFADVIGQLCEPLVESRVQAREQGFRTYWDRRLSGTHFQNLTTWQSSLRDCLESFRVFVHNTVAHIALFHGEHYNDGVLFSPFAMDTGHWWTTQRLHVGGDVAWGAPQQYEPGKLPREYINAFGPQAADLHTWVSFTRQGPPGEPGGICSMVMVQAREQLTDPIARFCEAFFEAICRRDAITRLFLRQQEAYQAFGDHVNEVSHDLRTSLQHVVANVQDMKWALYHDLEKLTDEQRDLLDKVKHTIQNHAAYIGRLAPPNTLRRDDRLDNLDLFEVVREQADLARAAAIERGTDIICKDKLISKAFVVCPRVELARAIAALLDNAVKYSYSGKDVFWGGYTQLGEAVLWIQNYGIGIPPARLEEIKKRFVRGEVRDAKRERTGTGLGLTIATYVLEDLLKGALEIDSQQADGIVGAVDKYHRYVTTVRITLPAHIVEGLI